jgi:hypothetical protein
MWAVNGGLAFSSGATRTRRAGVIFYVIVEDALAGGTATRGEIVFYSVVEG